MDKEIEKKQLKGFSLFELLITMGILMLLSLIVFPVATQKAQESKLETYGSEIATDIYYQQQRSAFKEIDGGVAIYSNGYTLFDGPSLALATEKDVKTLPTNIQIHTISPTLGNEIFFTDGEFKATTYGSFLISDGFSTMRISINQEGLIEYEDI